MESQNLLIEKKDSVAVITLNRPHVLNILNTQAIQELNKAFHALSLEPEIQCVVLTGTGTVFAAGADIKEMVAMNLKAAYSFARRGQQLFDFIEAMPQVVLACVNGFALGGGCELACACDLRVLASHAKIGEPEVNLGIIPGFAGSVRLPRLIGLSSALQMVLTGEALSAPGSRPLWWVVKEAGLVTSSSEARRMIRQGAVEVDREKVTNADFPMVPGRGYLIQVGKRRFKRVILE